ncbi:enoyl-CoA hydratase-related protein [Thermocrispum municipale]|uniref:enoyl-CoA hydratase-related protein n=1 Tax=Thermocrispum municipale TaxID=37926 RepID=UPI0005B84274|nr:enoyl-CoA hydratase-related protein [Thermocrispum municipale]
MSEPQSPVRVERSGRVLVMTLARPQARNAVNGAVARDLEAAIDLLEGDDELWAGVLTGDGPVFCAGADLKVVANGGLGELVTERGGFAGLVRRERTKPVIAALNGDALAGGMEIAIACDLVLAARGVRLGIPEAARSLLAVGGALANLPRLIGEKAALELAMTAVPWPAERFVQLGLLSGVVPPEALREQALRLAESICANAPLAVRASRAAILAGRDLPEDARWELADRLLADLARTEDFKEGPASFLEKRPPRWTGR